MYNNVGIDAMKTRDIDLIRELMDDKLLAEDDKNKEEIFQEVFGDLELEENEELDE